MLTSVYSSVNKVLALSILVFSLCACSLQANEKQAALLPANNVQARAEIIKLVSQSLGGKKIPIAEDVFQHSSRLLLGKTTVISPKGVKVIRSDKGVALVFELVKQGDNCLLRRIDNAQEWLLATKNCIKR